MPRVVRLADVDLTDLDNFAAGFPHHLFELHRREAPVWRHEPTGHTPDGEAFWSVATYDEVLQVLRDPATFSSERGGDRRHGGTLLQDLEVAGSVLTMMDDPRHARLRRLVSTGLTPRRVARMEDDLRRRARTLVDDIEPGRPVDFVERVAAELPMQVICTLLGVPEEDRHELIEAVDPAFDVPEGDAGARLADAATTQARTIAYAAALIAEKRARPTDDMLSVVVHATLDDVEPPELSELELFAFFFLLFSAGSETTRNAIAGGLLALLERPDQLDDLRTDLRALPSFVEEVLRWTTPSPAQRRTATCTTALAGHTIEPGEKVLIWEGSANRDEQVFARPGDFDIRRDPNPHLTFGHGVHHCLGASLARLEIRALFAELLPRFSRYELLEPAEWDAQQPPHRAPAPARRLRGDLGCRHHAVRPDPRRRPRRLVLGTPREPRRGDLRLRRRRHAGAGRDVVGGGEAELLPGPRRSDRPPWLRAVAPDAADPVHRDLPDRPVARRPVHVHRDDRRPVGRAGLGPPHRSGADPRRSDRAPRGHSPFYARPVELAEVLVGL